MRSITDPTGWGGTPPEEERPFERPARTTWRSRRRLERLRRELAAKQGASRAPEHRLPALMPGDPVPAPSPPDEPQLAPEPASPPARVPEPAAAATDEPVAPPRGGAIDATDVRRAPSDPRGADRRSRTALGEAAVILGFALLAVALYWPTNPISATRLPSGGGWDPAQAAWFLEWTAWALVHGHNPFLTNLVDYPSGINLANNTATLPLGLLASPITLTLGPVAAFNLLLRLGLASSAASCYLVMRRLRVGRGGAVLAALVYGFGPYLLSQAQGVAHLDLAFAPLPPVIAYLVYRLADRDASHRARRAVALGICAALQAYLAAEILADLAVVAIVVVLVAFARRPRDVVRRLRPALAPALVALGTFVVLASPLLYYLYLGPEHLVGPVAPTAVLQGFRDDLLSPILPTARELLAPASLAARADRFLDANTSENGGYLGLTLVVGVVAVAIARRRERLVRVASLAGLVALVLSLGDRLTLDDHTTATPLPEALLVHLHLLASTVPARYGLLVGLAAAVLAGVGLDRAIAAAQTARRGLHGRPGRPLGVLGAFVAAGLVLAPIVPRAPLAEPVVRPSGIEADLRVIPDGAVVLTYPIAIEPFVEPMLWQAVDRLRFRLVFAYATVDVGDEGFQGPGLRSPPYVQELFEAAQGGAAGFYPPPPTSPQPGALCRFVERERVDDVVFWRVGSNPDTVARVLADALGSPTRSRGPIEIWGGARRRCANRVSSA